jgi:Tol biopolymer transport system component
VKLHLVFIFCLSVSHLSVASQQSARVNSQHHKIDATEFPDNAVTPDRRHKIEQEWEGDSSYITIRDISTGAKTRLSEEGGYVFSPLLSPDGKMVAYARTVDSVTQLRVVGTDSTGSRIFYSKKDVDLVQIHEWSPNSKYFAASLISDRDRSITMVVSCVTNDSSRIIKEQKFKSLNANFQYNRMSFSADSRFIAYDLCRASAWYPRDIYAMPMSGGSEITLVQNPANDLLLGYFPDGHHILFASDRSGTWDLWVTSIDDDGKPVGATKAVIKNIGNTINGNYLFFTNAGFRSDGSYYYKKSASSIQLHLAKLDTVRNTIQDHKVVSTHPGFNISTQWSRDGKFLVYGWGLGYEYDPFTLGIRSFKDGTERKLKLSKLMRHGGHGFEPQWSPDGQHLLATARQRDYSGPGMDSQGLYMIDSKNGNATAFLLTDDICGINCIMTPLWLSNGKVIFERRLTESIVLKDIKTGDERILFHSDTAGQIRIWPGSNLAVSPDNRKLAFVLTDWALDITRLMVVSLEGDTPVELLSVKNGESITNPAWMPNSRDIVYAHNNGGDKQNFELCIISSTSGVTRSLGLRITGEGITGISIHPNGRDIAFTTDKISFNETWVVEDVLSKRKIGDQKRKIKQ